MTKQRIAPSVVVPIALSENLFLKASPPAHLSMFPPRGRRTQIHVASESWKIGAFIHNDYSLVRHQGEGKLSASQALPK